MRILHATLVGLAFLPLLVHSAGEDEAAATHERGVAYEVFHGDAIHRMGSHVREIHLPERGIAFYVLAGRLQVFRPAASRYVVEGETLRIPAPDGDGEIEVPVLAIPGCETRRVGEVEVLREHADRLEALLVSTTRLRAVADLYLLARDG